jgi:hypothetical protein
MVSVKGLPANRSSGGRTEMPYFRYGKKGGTASIRPFGFARIQKGVFII